MPAPRPTLPVIFRVESDATAATRRGPGRGYVTAVFPTEPGTPDPWSFTVYAHVGQHSTASKAWYYATKAARPDEFADLLAELRRIYEHGDDPVTLVVTHRFTNHHDKARRAALDATGREA